MKLSLITVNYNGADKTVRLIKSLMDQGDHEFEFFVVDNGSESGDRARLQKEVEHTPFVFVDAKQNLGFAGGNNIAARQAFANGADWVVLINNDTTVDGDFIARLKPELRDTREIVAIPLDEGERIAYGGVLEWLTATMRHSYDFSHAETLTDVGRLYAIGAGLALSRQCFDDVGLLDEAYFLYFEDADFSARAIKRGFFIRPIQGPVIHHEPSSSTKALGAPLLLRYHWRNAHYFNMRNAPLSRRLLLPFWSLIVLVRQFIKFFAMPQRRIYAKAITAGIMDWWHNRFGQIRQI